MREVGRDEVAKVLERSRDFRVPADILQIVDELGPYRELCQFIAEFFVDHLKLRNARDFLLSVGRAYALNVRDFEKISSHLKGSRRVLDVGCGWGGMTNVLDGAGFEVYAVDQALEHAVVTKHLTPRSRVFRGDVRDMNAFDDGYFDFVIAHGVIEHVGDYSQPVGHSGSNLHQQYRLVRELGRVTRIGGHALISTGNYLFPRDGEVDLWFYHWLPRAEKEAYNRATNRFNRSVLPPHMG